ncbi:MAG: thiamine pyrophosphate-binding protein, partial [Alphaproteobacteria bacterium]|nr:thiamine pyrophosphate-binding protein [Alphaproteobacteria bacterium]
MAQVNGGYLLARSLVDAGVSDVFALHGGHLDAFLQGCVACDIRLLDTRHEAAAGHAADGYARTTGRLGVVAVTAGPGFTNVYPALANAFVDGIPTLFILGAAPLREVETNPLQGGIDQIAMAAPVSKWAHRITQADRIPDLIELAIRKATTGRPGPVTIEVPIDICHSFVEEKSVSRPSGHAVTARAAPSAADLSAALELLGRAERPAVIVGGGALFADCQDGLRAFAERTGIPVFASRKGAGALPTGHAMDAGAVGNLGILHRATGQGPDAVLLLGQRLGLYTGGQSDSLLPYDCKLIQVDIEAAEIGRLRHIEVALVADCGAAIDALAGAAGEHDWPDWTSWRGQAVAAAGAYAASFGDPDPEAPAIHPFHAAGAVAAALPEDALIALDGGEASGWMDGHLRPQRPGQVLGHGYFGCLGIGPGMA